MTVVDVRLAIGWLVLAMAPLNGAAPPAFAKRFEQIRDSGTRDELYQFLWALPKGGDLHNHHEYSVPPEEWLRLAARGRTPYSGLIRFGDCQPVLNATSHRLPG